MELTEYDKKTFSNIETLQVGKWYDISADRPDRNELIESIKKFHDCWGLIEFSTDYSSFKIVLLENVVEKEIERLNELEKSENTTIKPDIELNSQSGLNTSEVKNNSTQGFKNTFSKREIPGYRSRPDIGERIMKEYNRKKSERTELLKKEQEKIEKIKKWKNN